MRAKKLNRKDQKDQKDGQTNGENLPEDRVKLPAVGGIRPGYYLAALYGLALLVILFFILCYPGIAKPGSLVAFSSEPAGAAVRIDGLTRGSTPCELFVPKGKRAIEMVLPGFSPFTIEADIGGRLAGSLFFPRRARVEGILTASDPLEALRLGASRYADWSFAGEPTAAYQIPQELSEGAYRSGPAASDPAAREAMEGILDAALRFTVTRAGLRDFIRAKTLAGNGGLAPSPVTLLRSARESLAGLPERPGAAAWLADLLPPEAAPVIAASGWDAAASVLPPEIRVEVGSETPAGSVEIKGLRFREIPGGTFTMGRVVPRRVTVDSFWIALTEVTSESWGAFLEANPEWGAAESLRERGLVTADYLEEIPSSPEGVGGISWYAAEAYCRWLTGLLPPALSVYEARLPLEAEWEYAAALNTASSGYTPEGLFDGRWEWCADPFAPLDFFPAPAEYIRAVSSPERSLRGGAWINPPGSVGPETRASLPPDLCSAFVSFRPVLARRVSP